MDRPDLEAINEWNRGREGPESWIRRDAQDAAQYAFALERENERLKGLLYAEQHGKHAERWNELWAERDAALARQRECEEALSWALDVLEITLKRLDTLEPPDCSAASIEHLKIRAAGIRKARAALSGEGANDAD